VRLDLAVAMRHWSGIYAEYVLQIRLLRVLDRLKRYAHRPRSQDRKRVRQNNQGSAKAALSASEIAVTN